LKFTEDADDVVCGLVLVLENRRLSNTIASRFGVRHESPQAIVLRDGRPYWNASHWAITTDALSKATKG
jgi:bacillithiol system protein YtxJ